jgi:hypothetical protein
LAGESPCFKRSPAKFVDMEVEVPEVPEVPDGRGAAEIGGVAWMPYLTAG